jgi:hypothetical protein
MLAFALAIPGDNTLIYQYTTTNSYKVWGAWNTEKQINTVTVINKIRGGSAVNVDIEIPSGWVAKRISLEAPGGLTAQSDITLAGMYYDTTTARLVGTYAEEVIYPDGNGRATVTVDSESLSIVFISAVDIGNVLLPAIEGTVSVDENGDIDVENSLPGILPDGAGARGPGSVKIGNAARSALAGYIGVLVMLFVF